MRINELIIASLKSEAGEADLRELAAWRAASPENERYYRDVVALWDLAEGGDDIAIRPPPTIGDIMAGRRAVDPGADREVVPLSSPPPRARGRARRRRWSRWWQVPVAAAAATAVLGLGTWVLATLLIQPAAAPLAQGADEFVTGSAETATVGLRDGSVIRLAPSSRLLLSGTMDRREVTLKGRAYLAVAPDEARPFRIRTEAGTVTVLGTRFDLQIDGEDLRLVVLEGRVALSAGARHTEVEAGEMARVLGGTLVPPVKIPDVFKMVDWVGNFLAFQSTPLGQAAREIEEVYGVRIEFGDPDVADRTVTGWFADRTLEQVLLIVCAVVSVQCTRVGDTVTIARGLELERVGTDASGTSLNYRVEPSNTSGGMQP
ncbi:MAG TPA: FecR domain-containing protein [Longimicrobiales bacterium]|nr:FecR domain-containing protein [Longimicrobiales bacterium]